MTFFLYAITGVVLFSMGIRGLVAYSHILRKVLSINIMSTGIFIFLVAASNRNPFGLPDPVPHAIVLAGIVVGVSTTALMLAFVLRIHSLTGSLDYPTISKYRGKGKQR